MPTRLSPEPTYTLDVLPGSRIARFHWCGPIRTEDRHKNVRRMVKFCREHDIRCLLIDGRDQEPLSGTVDDFDFAKDVPLNMQGLSIAVVHRPDDAVLPFIETVAFNRGGNTRSFEETGPALEWLETQAKPK